MTSTPDNASTVAPSAGREKPALRDAPACLALGDASAQTGRARILLGCVCAIQGGKVNSVPKENVPSEVLDLPTVLGHASVKTTDSATLGTVTAWDRPVRKIVKVLTVRKWDVLAGFSTHPAVNTLVTALTDVHVTPPQESAKQDAKRAGKDDTATKDYVVKGASSGLTAATNVTATKLLPATPFRENAKVVAA